MGLPNIKTRTLVIAVVGLTLVGSIGAIALRAQMMGHGQDHGQGYTHDQSHDHMHGGDGTGHDEATMPGLRGANATPEESAEIAALFRAFETLTREVEPLPNGIRTVTRSSDPEVMDILISHVVVMIDRVARADDPQILIQSPTLDLLFLRGEDITSDIEVTDDGIIVTQTSPDPDVVQALQIHAGEVTAMVDRGMQAVHEMMMARSQ